jgi:hypothetical protein
VAFGLGVWWNGAAPSHFYARLVGELRSEAVPEKIIFLKYPERAGSKKLIEPMCYCFFMCLLSHLRLLSPPELGLSPAQALPATPQAQPVIDPKLCLSPAQAPPVVVPTPASMAMAPSTVSASTMMPTSATTPPWPQRWLEPASMARV